jgi:molecular chaperone HscB
MNYFEVFELPELLAIDPKALEKKFHDLSRKHHPDYFTTAPADEKSRALRMTALLNDAYRTLRHFTNRVEYLLLLHGFKSDGSKVPQSLLMEVFEINEQLEEIKMSGNPNGEQFDNLRQTIHAKRAKFDGALDDAATQWDNLVTQGASEPELQKQLSRLAEVLSESSYIRNLEDEIENRQGHYWKGSKAE